MCHVDARKSVERGAALLEFRTNARGTFVACTRAHATEAHARDRRCGQLRRARRFARATWLAWRIGWCVDFSGTALDRRRRSRRGGCARCWRSPHVRFDVAFVGRSLGVRGRGARADDRGRHPASRTTHGSKLVGCGRRRSFDDGRARSLGARCRERRGRGPTYSADILCRRHGAGALRPDPARPAPHSTRPNAAALPIASSARRQLSVCPPTAFCQTLCLDR